MSDVVIDREVGRRPLELRLRRALMGVDAMPVRYT
jgi:hypothetical protein